MSNDEFNAKVYLQRINLHINIEPTIECLIALHEAQHRAIPFENFDIALGRGIDISPSAIFNKLVRQNRGGYCLEVNQLLLMALIHFGFEARPLLGRVHITGEATGRSHQIVLVTINGEEWIVDAGFGADSPKAPLRLVFETEMQLHDQTAKLVEDDRFGVMLKMRTDNQWKSMYSFDLDYVCDGDLAYGNHFTSTHPESFFVIARTAALPIEDGMITLLNNTLKKRRRDDEVKIVLRDGQEYIDALKEYFNIDLDASYSDFRPIQNFPESH